MQTNLEPAGSATIVETPVSRAKSHHRAVSGRQAQDSISAPLLAPSVLTSLVSSKLSLLSWPQNGRQGFSQFSGLPAEAWLSISGYPPKPMK